MKKMRSVWLSLGLVALTASCRFSPLPDLASSDGAINDAAPVPPEFELLAGDIGGSGNLDGTGAATRFYGPRGVAVDSAGNVYVTDRDNHIIRKVTAAGVVTTLAGTTGKPGSTDGTGAVARFSSPAGVAVDSAGNVYVADMDNNTIRKITAAGVVTTLAGTAGEPGSTDGTGAAARFFVPSGVAVDREGNVYVAESANNTIRKITNAGVVTTLAGAAFTSGSIDGTGAGARFNVPSGVAVDSAGNVYVTDRNNHTVRKVTAAGVVTTLAGTAGTSGSTDGTGSAARFKAPYGVAVDSAGNLYVADRDNHAIRKITAGNVMTLAGTASMVGSMDGMGVAARFSYPQGAAVDSAGNVYVADTENHTIRKVTAAGIVTTLAGAANTFGSTDSTGTAARFNAPSGVAVDSAGNVYVTDTGNHTIRKVTVTGIVTTLAGTAGIEGSTDSTAAPARFRYPTGVAVDNAGNVYVADYANFTIRKITTAGDVRTLAGTAGMTGSTNGIGAAARFSAPSGVAVDSAGNVYAADEGNHTIRKVTAAGDVTTLAGTAGMSGSTDGTSTTARFHFPRDVAVDSAGNVYVADTNNHTIRKVTATGDVTTLAGTAGMSGSTDGTGAAARFYYPISVAVDSAGNVYVADQLNSTIRKVTIAGVTTTIAGMAGMAGVLLGTTPRLAFPKGLAITGDSIVISDANAILLLRHGALQ
jgi:NHL repeat